MNTVKGSKQYRMRVVRHRPWVPFIFVLVAIIAVLTAGGVSYRAGFATGIADKQQLELSVAKLAKDVELKSQAVLSLEQKLANAKLGASVDRQSSEDVRKEIADLNNQLAELQADNSFYRNLMAPTENQRGLAFGAVELVDTSDPSQFNFKVVVQQLSTSHNLLSGKLEVVVLGEQNGVPASYFLSDLSPEIKSKSIKLRFKYFQTIEGSIVLPVGFDAKGIELVASSVGKNAVTIKKRFGWLVEKR